MRYSFLMAGEPLQVPPAGFDELSVDEQLSYLESLWDHIAAQPERVPIPGWHLRIVRERMESDSPRRSWPEVRRDIEEKLGLTRK
jgi:hypothetical protein